MATIISVASGKGGVGKSVVVGNLALVLTLLGKRIILADLDVGGADLHILFGLFHPSATMTDFLARRVDSLEAVAQSITRHAGLRLIPGTGETLATANMPYAKKRRLIRHLRKLEADIILIDVGAGTGYHALDFFLMADHHVAVTTTDPTSVLDLYRFIKLAAIRRVLSEFQGRHPAMADLADRDFSSVEEVLRIAGSTDETVHAIAAKAVAGFCPSLILNRTTGTRRVNTLHLKKLLKAYVGSDLTLLGEVPEDSAVERSVLSYLPVVEAAPESPAARAFAKIGERLLATVLSGSRSTTTSVEHAWSAMEGG